MAKIDEQLKAKLAEMPAKVEYEKLPQWKPAVNDILTGRVISREKGFTEETEKMTFLGVETEKDGKFSVLENVVIHKVLDKAGCDVGDYVGLQYLGEIVGRKKRLYKNYKVTVIKK